MKKLIIILIASVIGAAAQTPKMTQYGPCLQGQCLRRDPDNKRAVCLACDGGVKPITCSGTDKISSIAEDGTPSCTTDQTGAGGGGLNSGDIVLRLSACGTGFTQVASLEGKFIVGTVAANSDVGDTGGSDTVTSVINHTHTVNVTDPGHLHTLQRYPTSTGTSSGFTADTSMSGTPAAVTLPMQSKTTGITAATVNPAGGVASIDNRPAFVKVIFCAKD
jgi:hypothetical protein